MQVKSFLGQPLDHSSFHYGYLDANYLHGRLGQKMQELTREVVVAIGYD